MPVYEYQCLTNGHRFDLYQAVGAESPACPICGSATRKVYTSVGLIFKGSGFHVTDYRRPAAAEGDGKGAEKGSAAQTTPSAEKNGAAGKGTTDKSEKPKSAEPKTAT